MIPLFAPSRANEPLLKAIEERVLKVLKSGEYILGGEVDAFEKALAARTGFAHAVGVSNGTDALVLAIRALELPKDAEVITPAFSFIASASAVDWAGVVPVFADVSAETANVTVASVAAAVTPKTRAVIAVDLFGRRAPIADLRKFCDERGLTLIEDGAQSIGVRGEAHPHVFTTSFYPTKNLGGIGDGGAVLTDDATLATRVREMSRHGGLQRDHYVRVGTTGRLDAIQAAALNVKLPELEKWTEGRRELAQRYQEAFAPFFATNRLAPFSDVPTAEEHVWALYTVRFPKERAAAMEFLRGKGVGCAPYYPKALSDQPALQKYARGEYPASVQLAGEVLSLPFFPELTSQEFHSVVNCVAEWLDVSK